MADSSLYHLTPAHELVHAFNQRDEHAFARIYELYYGAVFFYAKKMLDPDQARDITAETFIDLWHGKRDFEHLGHVLSHLRIVARNKCVDRIRQKAREQALTEQLSYLSDQQDEILFRDSLIHSGILQQIEAEVDKLPPFHRSIFRLSYFDGLSNAEIAQQLQVKDSTVRTKKAEALRILRAALGNIDLPVFLWLLSRLLKNN
ncbi:MAG: sigma-70 family RNA polymerase sigma factor [Candidatus Pseudobacter hemicellulosilyticus]|uniref:Sigma-70 family RNA polymerase sigma factor n=1 Tax=Candidatus Pseudobacter hemicellulosilyticus TaxID=3121375 RepID=A0AAJ5WRJ0_9BACT|nr:MAG: sigma-70 family RNA polymerase sigma factor [Pseudobacter sp.]